MNMGQDRQMQMVGGNGGISIDSMMGRMLGIGMDIMQYRLSGIRLFKMQFRIQIRCYNCKGLGHLARNCTVRPRKRDAAFLKTQLLITQKEEAGIQLQGEEFDFIPAVGDLEKIEEVNANYILMANLQQASTSGT
nr:Gag-Pol polyprotein [Tanacetum cinerariifolium]